MIGFRLDANSHVATGHLMRCITIAKACRKLGKNCIFILSDGDCKDILEKNQFDYIILNINWNDWDNGIECVKQIIKEKRISLLVVDSYNATASFFSEINNVIPVFYIDDLCREAFDVTTVLHYSQWSDELTLQNLYKGKSANLLYGMQYMPLRDEFWTGAEEQKKNQIMITTGGTDPFHVTLDLAKKILKSKILNKFKCVTIVGKLNSDLQELLEISQQNKRLEVMHDISNMGDVMRNSNFAVSAGGCTIYELCACDVPTVAFAFSNDQTTFCEKMEMHQILVYAGDARGKKNEVENNIVYELEQLCKDIGRQKIYRKNMKKIVDGKGADRIAEYIIKEIKVK